MTPDHILALAAAGESETTEFKATTGRRREAAQTLCAMLNSQGGRVVFGVTPDGQVAGQQVSDETIEDVVAEIQMIDPPAFPTIDRVSIDGSREAIMVSVIQGHTRPYRHRGEAYRRVGNTTLKMSQDEYNRMLFERMHNEQRWENQPAPGWSTDDLDVAEIVFTVEESIRRGRLDEPGTRDPAALLQGLGLVKDGHILRAAVALFGDNERVGREMTQSLLRVARFRGLDRAADFLDNRQFRGNAFTLLRRAERFLIESLPVASRVIPNRFARVDEPLYPPEALREALANAICHRDYAIGGGSVGVAMYDDRLEVTSTGPLHFGLTPEKLFVPHESQPWNPLIAGAFYRRGIIEQWGRGTIKMAELTESAGLPRPEIADSGGGVTVTFRPGQYIPPQRAGRDLTERQQAILVLLHDSGGGMAARDIRAELDPQIGDRQLSRELDTLRTLELVSLTGHGRGAKWNIA